MSDITVKCETAYGGKSHIDIILTPEEIAKLYVDMTGEQKRIFLNEAYSTMRNMYPSRYEDALRALELINGENT